MHGVCGGLLLGCGNRCDDMYGVRGGNSARRYWTSFVYSVHGGNLLEISRSGVHGLSSGKAQQLRQQFKLCWMLQV